MICVLMLYAFANSTAFSLPGTGEIMVFSHYCHIRTEVSILIRYARGASSNAAVFAADLLSGVYLGYLLWTFYR